MGYIMQNSLEISKYLLAKINIERFEDIGDGISNLKIQKLLFYAQKTYVSVYGKGFFNDDIEAWRYGPVVPQAYHYFKKYNSYNIDIVNEREFITNKEPLAFDDLLIVDFVWDKYAKYSAGALVDITHTDKAWRDNYFPNVNNTIPLSHLRDEKLENEFLAYKNALQNISELRL